MAAVVAANVCMCVRVCSRLPEPDAEGSGVYQTFHPAELAETTRNTEWTHQRPEGDLELAARISDNADYQW